MLTYVSIANVCFSCELDSIVMKRFCETISTYSKIEENKMPDVNLECHRNNYVKFYDLDFIKREEPKYIGDGLYREIFDLGTFYYSRTQKKIWIEYKIVEDYPLDPYEVLVDTILQFMHLAMIDYGMLPIHASVINWERNGILVFGNSGSGKTTFQLTMYNSGGKFFADDCAFLDKNLRIYSDKGKKIAYTQNTKNIMEQCFKTKLPDVKNHKGCIYPKCSVMDELKPAIIIFPEQNKYSLEYRIKEISAKETLCRLIRYHVSNEYAISEKKLYWERFVLLSQKSPAYVFEWCTKFDKNKYLSFFKMLVSDINKRTEINV